MFKIVLIFYLSFISVLVVPTATAYAAEYVIPNQSDWTDIGIAVSGANIGWDKYLGGAITPCSVIKKNGVYYLYYVGYDEFRADGGPAHRKLGLATSTNGTTFTKYSGNPIITYSPANNNEEGVFSCGAALDSSGTIQLYWGAMGASSSTSTNVWSDIRLSTSTNGTSFNDKGVVVSHSSSAWNSGDEMFPIGAFNWSGKWYVYYTAKGSVGVWKLGLAQGTSTTNIAGDTRAVTSDGNLVAAGGADGPFFLGNDKILVFTKDTYNKPILARTAILSSPQTLSAPLQTYNFSNTYHATFYLDTQAGKWFMYYSDSTAGDKIIRVRTAPVIGGDGPSNTPTPTSGVNTPTPKPSNTPTSSPGKPGDANGDGKIDGLDYVIWLNHYNQSATGTANGDFNNSGKVDGLDYVIWLTNYGI